MEAQLTSIAQALWLMVFLMGIMIFIVGAVVMAEFMRRERTTRQDDDWMNFGSKDDERIN